MKRFLTRWMWLGFFVTAVSSHAVTNLVGDLVLEAQRLEGFSRNFYGEGSNNYVAPTSVEWGQFQSAAQALFEGNAVAAENLAIALDYELLSFTHTNPATSLWGLRSRESNGVPVKGWGTYFLNTNAAVHALIEAPHPQWDIRTPLLAADVFLKSGARGLLIAGAHRHVNGNGTADPADLTNTIFHAVHLAWNGLNGENTAWQIHGYSPANHPQFPSDAQAVLSTGASGTNHMSTHVLTLDQQLEWNGMKAYAYNKYLPANDPLNLQVNQGVDGQTFTNLAAQSNVQGKASRNLGGTFMHVETATFLRTNPASRLVVGDAVANAVLLSRTNFPPLSPFALHSPIWSGNQFLFSLPTERFHAYQAESKTSLTDNVWTVWKTFPGQGLMQTLTNSGTNAPRFHRLQGRQSTHFPRPLFAKM